MRNYNLVKECGHDQIFNMLL